ncbi:hypothetical protein SRHO_G00108180 [Serrasalmus rhombeus]
MAEGKESEQMQQTFETRSQVSGSRPSSRTSRSSASSAATRARAKAEAARAQFSYAEKEAEMLKEKAKIEEEHQKSTAEAARRKADVEANLYVLKLKREAVVASAEAAVYESAAAEIEDGHLRELAHLTTQDPVQRTNEYVHSHSLGQYTQQQFPDSVVPQSTPRDELPLANATSVTKNAHASPSPVRKPYTEDNPNYNMTTAEQSRHYPLPQSHASCLSDHTFKKLETSDVTKLALIFLFIQKVYEAALGLRGWCISVYVGYI